LKKPAGFKTKLPSRNQAVGMLVAEEFPLPLDKMQKIITSPQVEQIFKPSYFSYSSDLAPEKARSSRVSRPAASSSHPIM